MVQWVSPGSAFEHALIVRTFLQAFPNATLWLGGDLLVGSPSPLRLSRAELEARLADPASPRQPGRSRLQPRPGRPGPVPRPPPPTVNSPPPPATGPILTDDHPILEYFQSQDIPTDPPDLGHFTARPSRQIRPH